MKFKLYKSKRQHGYPSTEIWYVRSYVKDIQCSAAVRGKRDGKLLSNTKEQSTDTHNLNECQENYAT